MGSVAPAASVVLVDLTKSGTLQADHLDAVTEEARRVCSAYPNKAAAVIVAPTMISSRVIAGKRGELRQVLLSLGVYLEGRRT